MVAYMENGELQMCIRDRISHLQEFILELGKGFCFEARQKRIIIDDEYYYPDLLFYNRILHCGVIIELKNEEFSHENLGQLNAYVSYYKENEMQLGDNPPCLLYTSPFSPTINIADGWNRLRKRSKPVV